MASVLLITYQGRQGSVLAQNTILKLDQWSTESKIGGEPIDGASNFRYIFFLILSSYLHKYLSLSRKIRMWPLYGVAQPTIQGIKNVLRALSYLTPHGLPPRSGKAPVSSVCWINLREEPICYVNGMNQWTNASFEKKSNLN
jgi:hypothetical protein